MELAKTFTTSLIDTDGKHKKFTARASIPVREKDPSGDILIYWDGTDVPVPLNDLPAFSQMDVLRWARKESADYVAYTELTGNSQWREAQTIFTEKE